KDDVVAKIKQSLPLEDLLRKYTRLIPSGPGGWFKCCCPFHDDHTPSMWVNTELGLCNCWKPSCIAHRARPLDVINVYGLLTGLKNGEAIRHLAVQLFNS
ncbi:hypothetical protein GF380_02405, partial [Candidatus Uhrbacteria bacterium]|nr:hypothetical protein [Candidatus Uhrbacteria bacterium]